MNINDKFELIVIYHKEIGGPEPDPSRPGVVRHLKTGELYVLEPLEEKHENS